VFLVPLLQACVAVSLQPFQQPPGIRAPISMFATVQLNPGDSLLAVMWQATWLHSGGLAYIDGSALQQHRTHCRLACRTRSPCR
jgi:hypothetical protein